MSTDILRRILAAKAEEVAARAAARPLAAVRAAADAANRTAPPRGFLRAIQRTHAAGGAAVIAELKKASPSRGVIRADFDAAALAQELAAAGAACLSVLTDEAWFAGHDQNLAAAREACELPLLRKDFTLDPYQVFEARALGADAVLLIVAALGDPALAELAGLAHALGMDALVEVHDRDELARAQRLPCRLVGINNRDLRSFETTLSTTLELTTEMDAERVAVSESGIDTPADVALLRRHGVHTFLIGETLMRAPSPGAKLQHLLAP